MGKLIKEFKIKELMMDCYRELYKNSNPIADFDELVLNSTRNAQNQVEIPFMDYEIDGNLMNTIINKYTIQIKNDWQRKQFRTLIQLGCSPKTKLNNE